MNAIENYGSLMWTIRCRFDVVGTLKQSEVDPFSRAESAAFHGRKIVEAIAFGCLAAIDNGLKFIPPDAKGQWNAEKIFKNLRAKNIAVLPSPGSIREATVEEKECDQVKSIIEGIPERRLSHEDLIEIYQGLHKWLHEVNPYVYQNHTDFYAKNSERLWRDIERLHLFLESHLISIHGAAFFCVLRDKIDRQTKVLPLSKIQD